VISGDETKKNKCDEIKETQKQNKNTTGMMKKTKKQNFSSVTDK
tara:strand:+ start:537 stop:668 length:132 start_codon:yes stop_codon:yes gene_type:complete